MSTNRQKLRAIREVYLGDSSSEILKSFTFQREVFKPAYGLKSGVEDHYLWKMYLVQRRKEVREFVAKTGKKPEHIRQEDFVRLGYEYLLYNPNEPVRGIINLSVYAVLKDAGYQLWPKRPVAAALAGLGGFFGAMPPFLEEPSFSRPMGGC